MTGFGRNPCCCGPCTCGCAGRFPGDADYTECIWDNIASDWVGFPAEYRGGATQAVWSRVITDSVCLLGKTGNPSSPNNNALYKQVNYSGSGTIDAYCEFYHFSGSSNPRTIRLTVDDEPAPIVGGGGQIGFYVQTFAGSGSGPTDKITIGSNWSATQFSHSGPTLPLSGRIDVKLTIVPSGSDCDMTAVINGVTYGPHNEVGHRPTTSTLNVGPFMATDSGQVDCFWYRDS